MTNSYQPSQIAKVAKRAVASALPGRKVSGRSDRGWVRISIDIEKPPACVCEDGSPYCRACVASKVTATETARNAAYKAIKEHKLELATFTGDDGFNTEHDCMIITVNII